MQLSGEPSAEGRLDLLLVRLAQEANQSADGLVLADSQKVAISGLILATAQSERLPHYGTGNLLEHASKLGLDLVEDWVWGRIDYLQHSGPNLHMDDLPADLEPMVKARREALNSNEMFARLVALYEDDNLTFWARQATEQAISWLADSTPELTAQIVQWSSQAGGLARAATFLARTTEWEIFTERARLLLHAHPHDSSMGTTIIDVRRPMEFCGSGEPQYRAEAQQFSTWLDSDDGMLAAIGRRAVDHYHNLADEAAASDEVERQGFGSWLSGAWHSWPVPRRCAGQQDRNVKWSMAHQGPAGRDGAPDWSRCRPVRCAVRYGRHEFWGCWSSARASRVSSAEGRRGACDRGFLRGWALRRPVVVTDGAGCQVPSGEQSVTDRRIFAVDESACGTDEGTQIVLLWVRAL